MRGSMLFHAFIIFFCVAMCLSRPPAVSSQVKQESDVNLLALLIPRAEAGDAEAQNEIGFRYAYGRGVARDCSQALHWLHAAAEQGLAAGQYNLGHLYAKGFCAPQDFLQAALWYKKAADQGFAPA